LTGKHYKETDIELHEVDSFTQQILNIMDEHVNNYRVSEQVSLSKNSTTRP